MRRPGRKDTRASSYLILTGVSNNSSRMPRYLRETSSPDKNQLPPTLWHWTGVIMALVSREENKNNSVAYDKRTVPYYRP